MSKSILQRQVGADWQAQFPELDPVLARIYAARHVGSAAELEYGLEHLPSPALMKGMAAAVAVLQVALQQQKRILVVGDFDADGATSTTVALRALRWLDGFI